MPRLGPNERPQWKREETDSLILRTLHRADDSGGLRFTELLRKTGLSRGTVSRHLKRLFKKGSVAHGYLTKRYSITQGGLKRLQMYERQNALRRAKYSHTLTSIDRQAVEKISYTKSVKLGDALIAISEFMGGLAEMLRSCGFYTPSLDYEPLQRCLSLHIASDRPLDEGLELLQELLFIFEFDENKLKDSKED